MIFGLSSRREAVAPLALLAAAAAVVSILAADAAAQSLWMPRDGRHAISLQFLRPNVEGTSSEAISGAFYLSGRAPVSPTVSIVAEFSGARFRAKDQGMVTSPPGTIFEDYRAPSTTLGNPYVGLEAKVPGTPIFLEVGGRPPIASDGEFNAQIVGVMSDITRYFAFTESYASVQAAFNLYEVTPSKIAYRFRISPLLALPSEGYLDVEGFTHYSVGLGYHGPMARVGMGVAGLILLTQGGSNLGERNLSQLELHGDFLSGPIRPGLDVHVPLDALAEDVPVVVGASLSWVR